MKQMVYDNDVLVIINRHIARLGKKGTTIQAYNLIKLRDYVQNVENFRKELEKDGDMPACRAWALMKLKNARGSPEMSEDRGDGKRT